MVEKYKYLDGAGVRSANKSFLSFLHKRFKYHYSQSISIKHRWGKNEIW